MIYTVTFNPSLDYIVSIDDFHLGKTNRTRTEQMLPGGKGINVSTVLHNLGIENTALGFTAGFTGEELLRKMKEIGFYCDFIPLEHGCSRINIKMKDFDGTEINGQGPSISQEAIRRLMEKLDQLTSGDTLVLAGSIPKSMPDSIYRDILSSLSGRSIQFVVDATQNLLLNVLEYHPFLIKPNNHELGELFHVELNTREEVVPCAKKLQEMGARNVLVSMAGQGAVLAAENGEIHMQPAPKGTLVNAVGAGDSMVAGFVAGWTRKQDYRHAFRMGISAGSASAFSDLLASKEEIYRIYDSLVEKQQHSFNGV
ncbi:MAG: 1-phosphofructokinase [Lachnospiraceae bacterium]|jgi:1-phosphofructokinase|nr:1-phosphofructokinase [Lachnospiraceae bacterium]